MEDQAKGRSIARTEKTVADVERDYRSAIRRLTALSIRYQSGLAHCGEEHGETESRLRFAYESKKSRIEERLATEKSRSHNLLHDTIKDMERRKANELSTIKSRASMMRKEIATTMDMSSKAVQRAHRALRAVNRSSLLFIL